MKSIKFPKEQMHRIKYTKLTKEQIDQKLVTALPVLSADPSIRTLSPGSRLRL